MESNFIKPSPTIILTGDDSYQRLDKFISNQLSNYSRSFLQDLITQGYVKVNEIPITKSSFEIKPNDKIEILFPEREIPTGLDITQDLGIKVLYTHKDFLIIYKPPSIIVHSPSSFSQTVTLVDWLIHHFNEIKTVGSIERPGIVHRLDKDTSGLLIIARNNQAHMIFSNLFKERLISKTYLAIIQGVPATTGLISYKIIRDPIFKHKMIHSTMAGKDALTYYKLLEIYKDSSLVEVNPVTGRTHQIRVHFSSIGHPLIGDKVYGTTSPLINRQALHAYRLSFMYENIYYSFLSDMPGDMKDLIKQLKK